MITLRFAAASETGRAMRDVCAWGYRELEPGEPERSSWIALERGADEPIAWCWLQWDGQLGRDALFHACVAPEARGRIWTRHAIEGVRWAAELFGCERLWTVPPEDLAHYLRRAGWQEPKGGVFFCR